MPRYAHARQGDDDEEEEASSEEDEQEEERDAAGNLDSADDNPADQMVHCNLLLASSFVF